jgi:hypothetical protein
MGIKDRSLIDKINPIFIALTTTAIHHCLLAWTTGEFRLSPEVGPGGGAQRKCDTRNQNQVGNNSCTVVFLRLDAVFLSSSPEVQAKKIENIYSMICRRIHSTGIDPVMAQPDNDQGRCDVIFLDYVPEELIAQPENSFYPLSSIVAATEASTRFSAVLTAIASSSQPVPCSDSQTNRNDITNMTNVENTGFVDGTTVVVLGVFPKQ